MAGLTVDDIDDLQTTIRLAIVDWANRADINTEFCAMRDVKIHRVCEDGSVEIVQDIE